jgi:hypothetical protein
MSTPTSRETYAKKLREWWVDAIKQPSFMKSVISNPHIASDLGKIIDDIERA